MRTRALPIIVVLACGLGLAASVATAAPAPRPDLEARPGVPPDGHGGDTRCAACHTAEGWTPVKFAHERTGFPLEGRHRDVVCKACHASGTFADPVPRACAACHRDVHQGKLGQRCGDCHAATSWEDPAFGPDAHRRTAFPLTGRHAVIACEECHGDRRDRAFQRPVRDCAGCHEGDLLRATGGAAAVDHGQAGFPRDCRACHGAWRFTPATFAQHDACFAITSGPHRGIRCRDCHTSVPPVNLSQPLACASNTADCMRCHGTAAEEHDGVLGYAPQNPKCYQCHRFASVGD